MSAYTVLEQVKIRLKQFHMETVENDGLTSSTVMFDRKEDNPLLEQLINQATEDIKNKRRYPKDYTKEEIEEDLKKYESVLVNVVVYDRMKLGGDFQQSDSENGKSRTWVDRNTLFKEIYPIARIV
jgi:hypothetical protein|nr:MAG TPA: hypothetical protein [Caudoviricetes sp.]